MIGVWPVSSQWVTKDCYAFMAKNLQMVPKQRKEYEADLQKEEFLKEYKKYLVSRGLFNI